ncbi:NADH-quinone oxidoreductase subunit L [Acidithiobacillus caldus]|uniref:NADH-ubiquinone oxidoreductase chain L n=1 Tax=Acidithiobacillus caldus (strain SM-1) TaxID=990288 RepID=F9ZSJ1_ACICS|nr:NADH-quinone oxidoreductase subunit L [Acidithiobacillus caldus]AEK59196.1 NADH-ubiquinone oxidoreductase chain L [Acidithiobacillus caldus SM-1]AUW33582.1 NADH-quinone oxidoreductase subunit L [Acidithiobacillus caldus]QER43829.1 NADH-plastoquinone oxidoreductase, chain 5 [Acidithiobacillus caldus]
MWIFQWLHGQSPLFVYLLIPLAPLAGALIAGLFGWKLREQAHWFPILGVALSFVLSLHVLWQSVHGIGFYGNVYTWGVLGSLPVSIGFDIDSLTALMLVVVTFVSLCVHIYTIGYMHDDPGYARFFSYIALFTFSMLMLVMSNNFLQLFFGWEAVGLVSYLLIGFWFTRESANQAAIKAFLVNRVGDFGFLLGIAAIYHYCGSLDYRTVFAAVPGLVGQTVEIIPGAHWSVLTWIAILLFIGAMGKSAQVPLHVWLPESMEGPTPISALIHAATMVTAGIFMVARMSPIYEESTTALSVILLIGAITALSMGLIGLVQNDIKRIIAYSTLSQLGYMTAALGASAFSAAIFHLMTHAFFKALLFLAAGSVIHAMANEQDIRKMGGLRRHMPVTYVTFLSGSLALAGIPPFSGFFSKDLIIEAVGLSHIPGAGWAHAFLVLGVLVTALYTFRMFFLVFHGAPRMDEHTRAHLHESPWVITLPLLALSVPAVYAGWAYVRPVGLGSFLDTSLSIRPGLDTVAEIAAHWHGAWAFVLEGLMAWPFWLALSGIALAAYFYAWHDGVPARLDRALAPFSWILRKKYGFDAFNNGVLVPLALWFGRRFWHQGDEQVIDGWLVNGSAREVGRAALSWRRLQSGYIYHYAFAMIIGLVLFMSYFMIWRG